MRTNKGRCRCGGRVPESRRVADHAGGETSRASEGWDTGEAGRDRPCKTKGHPGAFEDSRQWMV